MTGGLIQLNAYGAQDIYLTSNPEITLFKIVYRRHTHFACETIKQNFTSTPTFDTTATVPITRAGDLITKLWLRTTISTTNTLTEIPISESETDYYILGSATSIISETTNGLTFSKNIGGTISVTDAGGNGDLFNNLILPGTVVLISNTINFNGYYTTVQDNTDSDIILLYDANKISNSVATEEEDTDAIIQIYDLAETFHWVKDIGYAIINYVELQIGGVKIDRHYGRFMYIWSQLTKCYNHETSYDKLVNCTDGSSSNTLYIPLQFFCCRTDGLALPLCSLQYHVVQLVFEFNSKANCVSSISYSDNISLSNTSLLVNYILLATEEREKFIQSSHEYLIDQVQHTGFDTISSSTTSEKTSNTTLYFNHPIKEFIWAISQASSSNPDTSKYKYINYTDNQTYLSGENPVSSALLQLNGHDRFSEESGKFFNYVQPLMHHKRTPGSGINLYSFSVNPEEFQPSGSCNFSRIDNAVLKITLSTDTNSFIGTKMYIFGIGYNVLRIMAGMGNLAYSN